MLLECARGHSGLQVLRGVRDVDQGIRPALGVTPLGVKLNDGNGAMNLGRASGYSSPNQSARISTSVIDMLGMAFTTRRKVFPVRPLLTADGKAPGDSVTATAIS